jgi:hypothetical protein
VGRAAHPPGALPAHFAGLCALHFAPQYDIRLIEKARPFKDKWPALKNDQ